MNKLGQNDLTRLPKNERYMKLDWIWYLVPFVPAITRGFMSQWFRSLMPEELKETEKDRDTHRSVIIPMAGFSFTALLALVVAEAELRLELQRIGVRSQFSLILAETVI